MRGQPVVFLGGGLLMLLILLIAAPGTAADDPGGRKAAPPGRQEAAPIQIDIRQLFIDGGAIGYVICGLSVCMVALMIEHALTIRRRTMVPTDIAEHVHKLLAEGHFTAAEEAAKANQSLLGYLLSAALAERSLGYSAMEKAMEDAAAERSARLLRKIEYLSIISTVAPMLGLMGTVWGMILAFMEFERKANPQVSELAPGVYKALVTTLFGLIVAIPAIAAFAFFRNRVDELVAQSSLMAEHVLADHKRQAALRKKQSRRRTEDEPEEPTNAG